MIGSFIREGLGDVLLDGFVGGHDGAEERADDGDAGGDWPPVVDRLLHQVPGVILHQRLRSIGEDDAKRGTEKRQEHCLPKKNVQNEAGGTAYGLDDSDLASSLEHRRVHGHEDHDKADDHGDRDNHPDEILEHADVVDGIQGDKRVHAVNLVVVELNLQVVGDLLSELRVVEL